MGPSATYVTEIQDISTLRKPGSHLQSLGISPFLWKSLANHSAEFEVYMSRQAFPKLVHQKQHAVRWDAGKMAVLCLNSVRLGQSRISSMGQILPGQRIGKSFHEEVQGRDKHLSQQIGTCARRNKLWTSACNISVFML